MNQKQYITAIESVNLIRRIGKVTQFLGLVVESNGPDVFLGERCEIHSHSHDKPVPAEVIGIRNGKVLLMPFGELRGIRLGSEVIATGESAKVSVGDSLLGRVIDGFGRPLDGKPLGVAECEYPMFSEPLNPLSRPRIKDVLETGIKVIDSLLTIGKGQRVGIFAGSGVGKSTLLGMLARHMDSDVNVIALIGERGREVLDFIELNLGEEGLKKSIVIVATSDQTALARSHAAHGATAIAEYFRDQGKDVVLMMDSVTRLAMAHREIGLSVGEPPTARGYTPSVFSMMPKLLERGGTSNSNGSITALYTVLVEGDDVNDPIADSIRSILDGHIVLTRELAQHHHYPAIDVLQSKSRLMSDILNKEELELSKAAVKILSTYEKSKDMVEIGAYRAGSNKPLDMAIKYISELNDFLCQDVDDKYLHSDTSEQLRSLLNGVEI